MFFRIVNGFVGVLFAFGAIVQYNDPDPVRWVVFYLTATAVCVIVAVRGKLSMWPPLGIGAMGLLWALTLLVRTSDASTYFHMFDSWEMKSAPVEEAREASGLSIVSVWMAVLAAHARSGARKSRSRFLLCLAMLLLPSLMYAQEPYPADPIVVSVSERALPISAVSASVTVFSRTDIEKSHALNVGELLQNTPGLHVSRLGGIGGRTTVSVRGGDPNFTLVLIDGVPVNDITDILGGSFDFSALSTVNIDRIEIIRGPLSSLYGSEAMSGVISIVTRSGSEGTSTDLSVSGGRFLSRDAQAAHRQQWGRLGLSVGASHTGVEEQVEGDSHHAENVHFKLDLDLQGGKRLETATAFLKSDTTGFPENGGGPLYSLTRATANRSAHQVTSSLEYTQSLRPWWNLRARVSLFDRRQELAVPAILDDTPPGPFTQPSVAGDSSVTRGDAYLGSEWRIRSDLHAIAGVGVRRETGHGETLIADVFPTSFSLTRSTPFVATEILYTRNDFGASFALRSDAPSTGERRHSPNIGFTYVSPNRRVRARMGLQWAFKLPSFFALADPSVGNPGLRPEENRAIDGGFSFYPGGGHSISVTFFNNRFEDLIDFSSETFQLVNRSVVHASGTEAELKVPISEMLSLTGQATFVSTRIEGTSESLRDRPRLRTGWSADWTPAPGWRVHPEVRWVSSRADFQIPVPGRNRAPSYWNTDLLVDYTKSRFTFFLRLQNLTDRKYEEFVGFPNPGISVSGGLSARVTP